MHEHVAISARLAVERLDGPAALADLAAEWEMLEQQIVPRSPFTSPAWIMPWWKHFRRRRALFRDEFFCHVVRDADGRLVAVAPLIRTYFPGFGPPVLRIVQFFGTDPSLTEIRGVICRPRDQERVIETLVDHFLRCAGEWDVFRWSGLLHSTSAYSLPGFDGEFIARDSLPDYILELPSNWDELRARVSSNMRKNLRKAYEFLERDGHSFTLRVVERPDEVQDAVERFLSLHAARSEAADMINHPNKFATPHARAFLNEYLQGIAMPGKLRIFELEIGGGVIASRLAFLLKPTLYMYFAGYDPRWRQYSVMTVLMSEMIKWALAQGLERVNLSTGNDQSKTRWKPIEVIYRDALQISPTRRGRIAYRAFRAYEALFRVRVKLGLYRVRKGTPHGPEALP